MKRRTKCALLPLLMLLCLSSSAQLYVAGGLFNHKYGGSYNQSHPGIEARVGYDYKEGKMGVAIGYNLSPIKGALYFPADYYDANSNTISVNYKGIVGMQNAYIHEYYRFGKPENKFHIRYVAGGSVDFLSIKFAPTNPVPEGYKTDIVADNVSTIGIKVDIGAAADYRFDSGELFAEYILSFPANSIQGQYYENPTVMHRGLLIGFRIYFGQRDYIFD